MNFGSALDALKNGKRVYRAGWNGWIKQVPDERSVYIYDAQGLLGPWLASQDDMLAEDWAEIARTDMNFGLALDALKEGRRVYRAGWNGKGMWIALQVPDEHSKMRRPYIYISDAQGLLVPWLASQADMLAEDWAEVAE
jgi:hypothetical protein